MTEHEIHTLVARLDERTSGIATDVAEIRAQTTKTNGRVSDIEKWRAWMTGALAALGLLSPIASALLVAYFTR